jgi:hypothetical protein
MTTVQKSSRAILVAAALMLIGLNADAVVLPPGASALPVGEVVPAGFAFVATTGVLPVTAPAAGLTGSRIGNFEAAVYRETAPSSICPMSGCLDFVYQYTSVGPGSITQATGLSFGGFTTDADFYFNGSTLGHGFVNGTAPPQYVGRSLSGNVITFTFNLPNDSFSINPGTTSDVLVVRTNATKFQTGTLALIAGGSFTSVNVFEPASAGTAGPIYEYDFFISGTTTVGASFRFPGFVRDYSPTNIPISGFAGFFPPDQSLPLVLNPCDLTSNSSGELDCVNPDTHSGSFSFIFNGGAFPRQLGTFVGSGHVSPFRNVPGMFTLNLLNGQIIQIQ